MPDLLRRVAALTLITAVGVAVLAPLSAASARPEADAPGLLATAGQAAAFANRGSVEGRERSATFSLDQLRGVIAPESLGDDQPLPSPASVTMEATLVQVAPVQFAAPVAPAPRVTAATVRGAASWYCCTIGYRGQAVVALPGPMGGRYDPALAARLVTVCADRCVQLPVVDYCDCYWGTSSQRVADLSPEAWAAISDRPTSRGLITVTVHL